MPTPYPRVRIKGTDLIGTRAKFKSEYRPFNTSAGPINVVTVYFEKTGEIRLFAEDVLEELPDEA